MNAITSPTTTGTVLSRNVALIFETGCLLMVLLMLWPLPVVGTITGLYLGVLLLAWFPTLLLNAVTRDNSSEVYRGTNIMFMVLLIFGCSILLISSYI
ncbi:MAG: hypothetical protein ACAI35_11295 [Candidatus Methylacidiphilales bacterium]|nr:hypothetical protein [Candidatus Methylacidiphilales bacterium]